MRLGRALKKNVLGLIDNFNILNKEEIIKEFEECFDSKVRVSCYRNNINTSKLKKIFNRYINRREGTYIFKHRISNKYILIGIENDINNIYSVEFCTKMV